MEMKNEITTIPIKWNQTDENISTLNCPICGKVWEEHEKEEVAPCEHLRFRSVDGCPVEYFGEWDHSNFDLDEIFDGKKIDDINMIYEFSEMGMSCGPVFTSILYGVKSGSKK